MGRKAEKCGVWSVKYRDIDRYIYIYILYLQGYNACTSSWTGDIYIYSYILYKNLYSF